MKKINFLVAFVAAVFTFAFSSCSKNDDKMPVPVVGASAVESSITSTSFDFTPTASDVEQFKYFVQESLDGESMSLDDVLAKGKDAKSNVTVRVDKLKPNTSYTVFLAGKNSDNSSNVIKFSVTTKDEVYMVSNTANSITIKVARPDAAYFGYIVVEKTYYDFSLQLPEPPTYEGMGMDPKKWLNYSDFSQSKPGSFTDEIVIDKAHNFNVGIGSVESLESGKTYVFIIVSLTGEVVASKNMVEGTDKIYTFTTK